MTRKERALLAVEALKKEYPDALCSLTYKDPLQLLIATRLAAQCTDARVNLVTPDLFRRFPTLDAFCEGSVEEIEAVCIRQRRATFTPCAGCCAMNLTELFPIR